MGPDVTGAIEPSDWQALMRFADEVGTQANPATMLHGRQPPHEAVDNGGAQARCLHDDEFEGVTLSDGSRHPLPF